MTYEQMNNIVVISGKREDISLFIYSIILRMAPSIYNKYGCIILKGLDCYKDLMDTIINKMEPANIKKISEKRKALINEKTGYTYPDAWEIVLKKVTEGKSLFEYVAERLEE